MFISHFMDLTGYHRKRNFRQTPEPQGARSHRSLARGSRSLPQRLPSKLRIIGKKNRKRTLSFVVQEHHASRLHYDFRLELDGVLKSWAVPKGPSMDPTIKRLAVMVEDHPFEYRTFEGRIPEGNYGAGMVYIWDKGTYIPADNESGSDPEKVLRASLRKGHVQFILHGKKLKGQFDLVKDKRSEKNWLLIKKADSNVAPHSQKKLVQQVYQLAEQDIMKAPLQPMMATLVDKAFNEEKWLFEIKWDGYRMIAKIHNHNVELTSRNNKSFNEIFTPIAESLRIFSYDAIFDGEVVVLDSEGKSQFQLLQNYRRTGKGTIMYYVFDLLYFKDKDLRSLPLLKRKKILKKNLPLLPNVRLSEHIEEAGKIFFKAATKRGLEGIIAKNGQSPYRDGVRSNDWLKIKLQQQQEAIIAGITSPRGNRKNFGALILGVYEKEKLVYIGHTGTGFSEKELKELKVHFSRYFTDSCPFEKEPKVNAPAQWMKPKLVCEIGFSEWTHDGVMRQPRFLGMREDKEPPEVHREIIKPTSVVTHEPQKSSFQKNIFSLNPELTFTHVNKIFWPKEKYTKGDLIDYYNEVWPFIMPYVKDRPQSLHRYPNGIHGDDFYQKNITSPIPAFVKTIKIFSKTEKKDINYIIANNKETLLYLANLGCIEINVWNSRIPNTDYPDYLVIDLDPVSIGFKKVIETAQAVRKAFDRIGIESFCKTSGATGLHIFTGLKSAYNSDQIIQFAKIIAYVVHYELPRISSIERNPEKRKRKVYLDYLQNRSHQTMVAPYCVRPRPGAPVSTPLTWEEVKPGLDPTQFTMKNIFQRLEKIGDIWKRVLTQQINLQKALDHIPHE